MGEVVAVEATAVEQAVAKRFAAIGEVSHVFTRRDDEGMSIWVALVDWQPRVRHLVFEKYRAVMKAFPEIPMDFTMMIDQGRGTDQLMYGEGAQLVYLRPNQVAIQA